MGGNIRYVLYQVIASILKVILIGDTIYLKTYGQPFVIINSYDTAVEILEKRSLNSSDRPGSVMVTEL